MGASDGHATGGIRKHTPGGIGGTDRHTIWRHTIGGIEGHTAEELGGHTTEGSGWQKVVKSYGAVQVTVADLIVLVLTSPPSSLIHPT